MRSTSTEPVIKKKKVIINVLHWLDDIRGFNESAGQRVGTHIILHIIICLVDYGYDLPFLYYI